VKSALGPELDSFAAKAGVDRDQAADGISKSLPELVDQLTPDGVVPSMDEIRRKIGTPASPVP
jgi:uncharacterized protein YidB (DUF937 family)